MFKPIDKEINNIGRYKSVNEKQQEKIRYLQDLKKTLVDYYTDQALNSEKVDDKYKNLAILIALEYSDSDSSVKNKIPLCDFYLQTFYYRGELMLDIKMINIWNDKIFKDKIKSLLIELKLKNEEAGFFQSFIDNLTQNHKKILLKSIDENQEYISDQITNIQTKVGAKPPLAVFNENKIKELDQIKINIEQKLISQVVLTEEDEINCMQLVESSQKDKFVIKNKKIEYMILKAKEEINSLKEEIPKLESKLLKMQQQPNEGIKN